MFPFPERTSLQPEPTINGRVYKQSFEVGQWPVGSTLVVKAVGADWTSSDDTVANFAVIPPPIPLLHALPWAGESGLNPFGYQDLLVYKTVEADVHVFNAGVEEIGGNIPGISGTPLKVVNSARFKSEFKGDGTGWADICVAFNNPEDAEKAFGQFGPVKFYLSFSGRPEWQYVELQAQWKIGG